MCKDKYCKEVFAEFDKLHDYYIGEINKLKAENNELRSDNSMLLSQGDADAFVISNINFKIQKLQQCLDEIDKILQEYHPLFVNTPLYMIDKVIRQIKEVKGNE